MHTNSVYPLTSLKRKTTAHRSRRRAVHLEGALAQSIGSRQRLGRGRLAAVEGANNTHWLVVWNLLRSINNVATLKGSSRWLIELCSGGYGIFLLKVPHKMSAGAHKMPSAERVCGIFPVKFHTKWLV